uniref:CHK domain-containing protein n=1 Tax=Anopheles merus TaxID=30066 RepID=A0A182VE78_ANOME
MSDTEEDSTCSDSWPITEDWLIEVLKKHHEVRSGIKITDFKVKQGCQDGVNNLSDILSVSVVYEFEKDIEPGVSQCLDIVIKLLPQDPFSRYFVTEAQFDLREIKFYTSPIEPMGLITHTDFWCNNLLFRSEPDEERTDSCTILDWQMVTYSRPTNDLALLLISSIPSNTRRQHTSRLLDLYYGALKSYCLKMDVDIEADLGYSRNKMEVISKNLSGIDIGS